MKLTASVLFCGVSLGMLLLQGCARQNDPEGWLPTQATSGRVVVNGEPAKGAIVRLYPVATQANANSPIVPTGTVQEDGSFQLTTYRSDDGAPEGEYKVTLEWPDPNMNSAKGGMPEDPPDRLKKRFSNPEKSTIKRSITSGENQLEPIVLEKVEILAGSSLK
ncbi:carboxypeptidase regulatory-like domain-containing protein [Planctomicrobium sp. SH661]|uniref:carboxypeptidase regulatory-like domain-containing protein n=1 Tax=Planctomicrobium sp. SH661 TaxID=3448124 RepID=UPI003F5BAB43